MTNIYCIANNGNLTDRLTFSLPCFWNWPQYRVPINLFKSMAFPLIQFVVFSTWYIEKYLAIDLQKSVLHLMWQPKQCNGPFNKSCCSFKTARCLSLSLLLIMMALLAALFSFFHIASVSLPFPL